MPSPDNRIEAVPLETPEQETAVVMPRPVMTAVLISAITFDTQAPPVT